MPYPTTFDLSAAAAQNPQESNTQGKGHREPFASLTNVVKNPVLLSLSQDGWEDVQSGSGPTTEADHSQTTNTTDTSAAVGTGGVNDANASAHNDLSGPNAQGLHAGLTSMGHTTGTADGRSVSSMSTLDPKTGESAYGTANAPYVDHEVSHMGPWAQDNISSLKMTPLPTIVVTDIRSIPTQRHVPVPTLSHMKPGTRDSRVSAFSQERAETHIRPLQRGKQTSKKAKRRKTNHD